MNRRRFVQAALALPWVLAAGNAGNAGHGGAAGAEAQEAGYPFQDPTGGDLLARAGALEAYRRLMAQTYAAAAAVPGTRFVPLAPSCSTWKRHEREWLAFPKRFGTRKPEEIDAKRTELQDEYVEWQVEHEGGRVTRVTFTTEFPDYWAALAAAGGAALCEGIGEVIPGAQPTPAELFGEGFQPDQATAEQRVQRFLAHLKQNPWNTTRGILCLSHRDSTLLLLFRLLANCAVPGTGNVEGACRLPYCVADRSADPRLCSAAQNLARGGASLTAPDSPGVEIAGLEGDWRGAGKPVRMDGLWKITRNGRRAVLEVPPDLTLGRQPVVTGAQVARKVRVRAALLASGA